MGVKLWLLVEALESGLADGDYIDGFEGDKDFSFK